MRVDSATSVPQPQTGTPGAPKLRSSEGGGAAFVGAARTSSFDFTLTTEDGDRVTLSTDTTDVLGAVSVTDKDGTRQAAVASSETTLSLTVEGSLDKDELRDVRKVTKFLAKAAAGYDVEKLARRLSRPDLGTVASVSASASQSLTLIGGVLAFGPAPALTEEPQPEQQESAA
jgi:hypothetical protein